MSSIIEMAGALRSPQPSGQPIQALDQPITADHVQATLSVAQWQSNELLGALLGALPAAIYTTDQAGKIMTYNQAAVDLWGCRPELGKSEWCGSWRLYWPDGKPMPHDKCPMAVSLREGRPIKGAEAIAERPNGSRVTFLAYPTPLRNGQGALIGAVNMLIDVTQIKQDEALANCQKQALQMLVEGAPLKAVLESLIDMMERSSANGVLGSIVLLNDSHTHFQRGIGLSLPEEFNAAMEGIAVNSFNGICCHAVVGRKEVISSDFNADPRWAHFAQFVAPYGLRAGWSTPIFGSDGNVLGTFANYYRQPCDPNPEDIRWVEIVTRTIALAVERHHAEQISRRLTSIVEWSDDAIASKDLHGIITTWNPAAERLFGYKQEEIIGKSVTVLIPEDQQDEEPEILARIKRGEHIDHYETVRRRKDGSLIEISLTVSPIRNAEGAIVGASKIARDISERRRAQEQRDLLLREMSHRIKNLFAVAGGLVMMSARSARTPTDLANELRQRLDALSRAHGLTRTELSDKAEKYTYGADLHSLVRTIIAPYLDSESSQGSGRLALSGPNVPIGQDAVTNISLVLHEFATNAAKYGALSSASGNVHIDWTVENDELLLKWEEHDGPPLNGPPERDGFGKFLADRTITGQFGGQLAYDWNPDGLIVRLSVPLERLSN